MKTPSCAALLLAGGASTRMGSPKALVTVDGTYIFGTNLFMLERKLIHGTAGAQVAVRYRFINSVAGGDYFLNLGCNQMTEGSDQFLDVRRSVARVKFAYTHGMVGFVNLAAEPDVVMLSAPARRALV